MIQQTATAHRAPHQVDWRAIEQPKLRTHYAALARALQTQRNGSAHLPYSVGVTACRFSEGVTTVAANLALNAANNSSRKVLLVDANVDRPSLSRHFRAAKQPGLTDCLFADSTPEECLLELVTEGSLSLLPVGRFTRSVSMNCDHLPTLLEELKTQFDLVVVDLPIADELSLCLPIARLLDGAVLVIRAERVTCEAATRVKDRLAQAHVNLLGAVFNEGK